MPTRSPKPTGSSSAKALSSSSTGPGLSSPTRRATRQGGAEKFRGAQSLVTETVDQLRARGLSDEEIRRLFEAELTGFTKAGGQGG